MPLHTGDALVLRTYTLGESDRIVVLLTRDRGKKRGVARGARRSRRRFGGALEPLTRVRVGYYEREQRDLVRLDYAEAVRSPLSAAGTESCVYASYFAELLDEWAPDNEPQERLYRLGVAALDALGEGGDARAVARYFEFWLLRLEGVYPSVRACPRCGGALENGAVLEARSHWYVCPACAAGAGGVRMSGAALRFLGENGRRSPVAVARLTLDPAAQAELQAAHRLLLVWHLDREPRSARVLRDMNP
jgi:DNA repair protein RecO (recombination protein O)